MYLEAYIIREQMFHFKWKLRTQVEVLHFISSACTHFSMLLLNYVELCSDCAVMVLSPLVLWVYFVYSFIPFCLWSAVCVCIMLTGPSVLTTILKLSVLSHNYSIWTTFYIVIYFMILILWILKMSLDQTSQLRG